MVPKLRSPKIPNKGLWSVMTYRFGQAVVKILECCKAQDTARASPSVGEYLLSAGLVNFDPAKVSFQPVLQQTGALSTGQEQYF